MQPCGDGGGKYAKRKLPLLHSRSGCISAQAEVASIYGDGLCGHLTASGERFCGWHGGGQATAATLLCFRKSTLVFTAPQFGHSKLWTARSVRVGCGLIASSFNGLRHFGQTSFIKRSKDRVSLLQ